VLRCGLTPKHVDVPELLRVLDFTAGPPSMVDGSGDGPVTTFRGEAEHFRLVRCAFDPSGPGSADDECVLPVPASGPRIVVVVDGGIRLCSERGEVRTLRKGQSMWVPACDGELRVARDPEVPGPALAFAAADGLPD
jgi:mannose-6-phosphate isomerase